MATIKEQILASVPTSCPACGSSLKLSDDLMHLSCMNSACSGKLYRRIEIMAKAFGIENIGVKVAEELVNELNLTAEHEIFDLSYNDFLKVPRYQAGMASRLLESISILKENPIGGGSRVKVPWANFIRGIQIARVGEGTAAEIAQGYKDLDSLLNTDPKELAKKLTSATVNSTTPMVNSIKERTEEILELAKRVEISYPTAEEIQPVEAKPITILAVVTGSLGFGSRPDFQKHFGANYGVKWASAVSGNVNILVTNEDFTVKKPTGKYKDAKELQAKGNPIQIMTEEEFISYIGGTSVAEDLLKTNNTASSAITSVGGMDIISL